MDNNRNYCKTKCYKLKKSYPCTQNQYMHNTYVV